MNESEKGGEQLKNILKQLEYSKDIMDKLSMDFTAVYVVDLNSGEFETLKLTKKTNALKMLTEKQKTYEMFHDYVAQYAEEYLPEDERQEFKKCFSYQYLKEQLCSMDRFVFHYRSFPNAGNWQYFEVQAVKLNCEAVDSEFIILVGIRHIDEVLVKEKQIHDRLQKALEEATLKNEIISAIGKSYYYISRIDLEADYYEVVSGEENFPVTAKLKGCMSKTFRHNCERIVAEEYLEAFLLFCDVSTMAERLQDEESIAMEYRTVNGDWRRTRLIVKKRDEQGRVTHVLCAVRSINDEKRRERQLALRVAEAKHETALKTRFLSNMSHDIRTPLNGIIGLLDMAEKFPDDLQMQEKCRKKIRELSKFLLSMVNDILDMNKLQSGEIVNQDITFDIADMLRTVNEAAQIKAGEKQIEYIIEWENSSFTNLYLVGNPLYTARILSILADNAIKFSHIGSSISVNCNEEQLDDKNVICEFVCKDYGIGMSKEFAEHAFELFSQENESSRTKYEGTGLGLAIAKKMTDLLHGTIRLESEKGVGTTATVRIPFKIGTSDDIDAAQDYKMISLQGLRVLLVEDNDLNMEIARFILEEQGITVEAAVNGQEAVELFEKSEPGYYNVILMDIMMPVLNGLDATRKIRALKRTDAEIIPVIAMSANAFSDDMIRSRLAGMNAHLAKPLDREKIGITIQKCLSQNSYTKIHNNRQRQNDLYS